MNNIREIILDMLLEMSGNDTYSSHLMKDVLDKYDYLEGRDKGFIKRVTEGTIERRIELDYVINQFSKTPVSKMKPLIRELLRMSVYQLLYMEGVPDSAVCNEAVKLAEKRKFHNLKGFVNGVLRNIARNKEKLEYPDKKNFEAYLNICYSVPMWLVKHFIDNYGKENAEKICCSFLEEKPVTIRLRENLTDTEKQQILDNIAKEGTGVSVHPYLPYAYLLDKVEGLNTLSDFVKGNFTVQDVSSMLVCECADIKQGDYVMDVCAAPGGKTMHAAEKLQGTGMVEARDLTLYKTELIRDNLKRMGYQNVTVKEWDASKEDREACEKADVLLADVPCSGLGVIGKKQDIKYRISPDSFDEIVLLQKQIVEQTINYTKVGGTFMYSTCTINPEENEKMVQWMCENYPLKLQSIDEYLPSDIRCETTQKGYIQLLPGVHQCDGFFLAKMKRVE